MNRQAHLPLSYRHMTIGRIRSSVLRLIPGETTPAIVPDVRRRKLYLSSRIRKATIKRDYALTASDFRGKPFETGVSLFVVAVAFIIGSQSSWATIFSLLLTALGIIVGLVPIFLKRSKTTIENSQNSTPLQANRRMKHIASR